MPMPMAQGPDCAAAWCVAMSAAQSSGTARCAQKGKRGMSKEYVERLSSKIQRVTVVRAYDVVALESVIRINFRQMAIFATVKRSLGYDLSRFLRNKPTHLPEIFSLACALASRTSLSKTI
jgi:hypothetical protein